MKTFIINTREYELIANDKTFKVEAETSEEAQQLVKDCEVLAIDNTTDYEPYFESQTRRNTVLDELKYGHSETIKGCKECRSVLEIQREALLQRQKELIEEIKAINNRLS